MILRITEDELACNVPAVLQQIERGSEFVVERGDHRPIAVIKKPQQIGRMISECIALARAHEEALGGVTLPDIDFSDDVQTAINSHRESLRNVWEE